MANHDGRRAVDGLGCDRLSLSFELFGEPDVECFRGGRVSTPIGGHGGSAGYSVTIPLNVGARLRGDVEVPVVHHSAFIGAACVDGAWFGKVETNPSRYSDPEGCSVLPLSDVLYAVHLMAELAYDVMGEWIAEDPATWKVTRFDMARDFRDVGDPGLWVRSLGPIPRAYARRTFTYNDPKRGAAQTLAVGSGAGMVRLYDQHAAYAHKGAPPGSLRWEAECRSGWLHGATVADLTSGFLVALADHRWEWSACGTPVATSERALVAWITSRLCDHKRPHQRCIVGCDGLAPSLGARLLGQYAVGAGTLSGGLSDRSRRRHSREGARLGIVHDPAGGAEVGGQVVRLDWATGSVLQVA